MESNQGRVVAGKEIFRTFADFPIPIVWELFEAFAGEQFSAPIYDVERWRGGIDKLKEFIC